MDPRDEPIVKAAVRALVEEEVRRMAPGLPLSRFWHVAKEAEDQRPVPGESLLSRMGRQLENALALAGGAQVKTFHTPHQWLDGQLAALEHELETGHHEAQSAKLRPGASSHPVHWVSFTLGALAAIALLRLSGLLHF